MIELSIVIPAHREAHKIEGDVRAAHTFLAAHFQGRGEIVVVDDGSPDDTAARARALVAEIAELRVISYPHHRGKGHALRAGVAATTGHAVLFADAGGCVPFADALAGIALLARGADCALGSRRAPGACIERRQPFHRRWGSRAFAVLVRLALGIPPGIRDTQCGFKVYRGAIARALFAQCFTDGFMLDIELLRRARRQGLVVREFPLRWRNDPDTRYRPWRGTLRNLRELWAIRTRA